MTQTDPHLTVMRLEMERDTVIKMIMAMSPIRPDDDYTSPLINAVADLIQRANELTANNNLHTNQEAL